MTSSSENCESCGAALPQDTIYCPNCGHSRIEAAPKANAGVIVLMVVAGAVVALPAWWLVVLAGMGLLSNVGLPPGPQPEFYVSWPATGFFIFVTLLAIGGLVFQARARISPPLRAFVIAFLCVMLGLFSICDVFALSNRGTPT